MTRFLALSRYPWHVLHRRTHPVPVDDCFGCRVLSVAVAPSATPSRRGGAEAQRINAKERQWQRDMGAYKEMRRQGLQPNHIDGAADLTARAETLTEIETGTVLTKKERAEVRALTDGEMAAP